MCLPCGWLDSELSHNTSISKTHLRTQDLPPHVLESVFPTAESVHHEGRGESVYPFLGDVPPSADDPFGGLGMHILTNLLGTPTQGWGPGGLPSRVRVQVMSAPRILL